MNGKVKKVKVKKTISFQTYAEAISQDYEQSLDQSLSVFDFSKIESTSQIAAILRILLTHSTK